MRRILLASAAVVAIALAAPFAGAQYTDPATDTYQTQVPDASVSGAVNDPMTPQTQQSPPPTTTPDPYASTYQPQTGTYTQPSTTMPSTSVQSQTTTTTGVTADTYGATTTQSTTADTYGATTTTQSTTTAQGAMATDTYAATNSATAPREADAVTLPVDLAETAQLAGMDSVPMAPADVCQARSVTLAEGTSRLNVRARRHLIIAADHSSVCEVQRVVVESPTGRADAVRQTLVDHGIDESMIEVQDSPDGELGVEMQFAGIAASTPQFAAMYNQLATGFAQASTQPGAAPTTGTYAPTTYQPTETSTQPGTQPISYAPVDGGAATEPTTYQPVTDATPTSYVPTTTSTTTYQPTTYAPTTSYAPATSEPIVTDPMLDDGTP